MKVSVISRSSRAGFTLVELLIVVGIILTLAVALLNKLNVGSGGDVGRQTALGDAAYYLDDFKQKYGVYPSAGSSARNYPKSGCSVSGYKSMVECFVSEGYFQKDDETYKKIAYDPREGTETDDGQKYAYKYCVSSKGNKYKLVALPEKQDDSVKYPTGEDGQPAEKGKRRMLVVSPATRLDEVSGCAE